MKNYEILWTDGYFYQIRINNADAVKELEDAGFYFDDFYGNGTERWCKA